MSAVEQQARACELRDSAVRLTRHALVELEEGRMTFAEAQALVTEAKRIYALSTDLLTAAA